MSVSEATEAPTSCNLDGHVEQQKDQGENYPSGPILKLSKSTIRHLEPSDAEEMARIADNPLIGRYMRDRFPFPYTLAHANWWINHNMTANPVYNYAIADPITDKFMGCIGLERGTDVQARTAEFGYWLGEEYWGKGIMTEAVIGFARWAFDRFEDLDRIFAGMFESNTGSVRVIERAGWMFEGRARKAIRKRGVVMDQLIYSYIRDDWERDEGKVGSK